MRWPPGLGREQVSPSRSSSPHSQFSPCMMLIYIWLHMIDWLIICFVHTANSQFFPTCKWLKVDQVGFYHPVLKQYWCRDDHLTSALGICGNLVQVACPSATKLTLPQIPSLDALVASRLQISSLPCRWPNKTNLFLDARVLIMTTQLPNYQEHTLSAGNGTRKQIHVWWRAASQSDGLPLSR